MISMDIGYYIFNIVKNSPLLLIGGYVSEFKKICMQYDNQFTVFYFREKADMDEFIDSNSGRKFPNVLVIELGKNLISHVDGLLKFVEDYPGPLIVTSSQDINNLVFLSRFKLEFRKSKEDIKFLLPSHKNTLNDGISEETKLSDPIIWYAYSKGMKTFIPMCNTYSRAESEVLKCIDIIYG